MFGSAVMSISLLLFIILPVQAFQTSIELENKHNDDTIEDEETMMLMQTDLTLSENVAFHKIKSDFPIASKSRDSWSSATQIFSTILGQGEAPSAKNLQTVENVKRFHRDFIAAALLMCCVLPWARQRQEDEDASRSESSSAGHEAECSSWAMRILSLDLPADLLLMAPAFHCLRYVSVAVLWLQHYWFQGSCFASQFLLLLTGFALDFVETGSNAGGNIWTKYASAIPERFTKLYPFYALQVLLCYLMFPIPGQGGSFVQQAFSGTSWFFSVVFGGYILMPVLTDQSHDVPDNVVAMISAACVALVILPRTLACPVTFLASGSPTFFDSPKDAAIVEMVLAQKTLLNGLAYFFAGVVIPRACLSLDVGKYAHLLGLAPSGPEKEEEADSNDQDTGKNSPYLHERFSEEVLNHTVIDSSTDVLSSDELSDCCDMDSLFSD